MNRRGFFGLLAAALASPRAVRLVPARRMLTLQPSESFTTPWIKLTPLPLKIVGLSGWLPIPPPGLPVSPAGRLLAASDLLEEGLIGHETFAELVEATQLNLDRVT